MSRSDVEMCGQGERSVDYDSTASVLNDNNVVFRGCNLGFLRGLVTLVGI